MQSRNIIAIGLVLSEVAEVIKTVGLSIRKYDVWKTKLFLPRLSLAGAARRFLAVLL